MQIINVTPESIRCAVGLCPAIYETDQGTYLLVGKQRTVNEVQLGSDEVLIEVPAKLLSLWRADSSTQG